jgi:hypothetical protein
MHHTGSDRSPAATAAGGDRHLRASDAERERAAARLREHASAGRLTMDELAGRVETALAARTHGELEALFEDLPARSGHDPARRAQAKAHEVRIHVRTYLWVSLGLVVLWAVTGMGYFWPMWPMLGWGIGVVSHTRACGFGPRVLLR